MKHLVIVGGGFAGVRLARKLRRTKNVYITLISDSEEFRYCPALYRSATGHKVGVSRLPLEWMLLDCPNLNLIIDKALSIDVDTKKLNLESGQIIEYDEIVFAIGVCGCRTWRFPYF